ncbi:MAG: response regulator [Bryobacterales bacterium]|nr:response regulator [Bryobacterales bacterium]
MQWPISSRVWAAVTIAIAAASLVTGVAQLVSIQHTYVLSAARTRDLSFATQGEGIVRQLQEGAFEQTPAKWADLQSRHLEALAHMAIGGKDDARMAQLLADTRALLRTVAGLRVGSSINMLDLDRVHAQAAVLEAEWKHLGAEIKLNLLADLSEPLVLWRYASGMTALALIACMLLIMQMYRIRANFSNAREEAARRAASARFENALNPAYIASSDGTILAANPPMANLLRVSRPAQSSIAAYLETPADWTTAAQAVRRGETVERTWRVKLADGSVVPTVHRLWPLCDETGAFTSIEASILDAGSPAAVEQTVLETEQLKTQLAEKDAILSQQQARVAEIQQLSQKRRSQHLQHLGEMSRYARQPLASLLHLAGSLTAGANSRELELLRESAANARTVLARLDTAAEYVELETTLPTPTRVPFSLRDVIDSAIRQVAAAAEAKHIDLTSLPAARLVDAYVGEPDTLTEVLTRILECSIRCADQGHVALNAYPISSNAEETLVRFTLVDPGCGLPPGAEEFLSDPMCAPPKSLVADVVLGYAIARRLVERLGGTFELDPNAGNTLRVSITLRLQKQVGVPYEEEVSPSLISILVVDDMPGSRAVTVSLLRAWGYHPITATSDVEAVREVRASAEMGTPIRIVLIDFSIPRRGGLDLAETLLEDPANAGMEIILMVPHSQRSCSGEPLLPRLRLVVPKPLSDRELLTAIKTCCSAQAGNEQIPSPMEPLRLLLAEDDPVSRRVAVRLIRRMGHQLDTVANGRQALESVTAQPYDLVFMDCEMPVMDGFAAARAIRQLPGSAGQTPIVALTANALTGDRQRCLDAGMSDYISKPFTYEDLRAAVYRWAEKPVQATAEEPVLNV